MLGSQWVSPGVFYFLKVNFLCCVTCSVLFYLKNAFFIIHTLPSYVFQQYGLDLTVYLNMDLIWLLCICFNHSNIKCWVCFLTVEPHLDDLLSNILASKKWFWCHENWPTFVITAYDAIFSLCGTHPLWATAETFCKVAILMK